MTGFKAWLAVAALLGTAAVATATYQASKLPAPPPRIPALVLKKAPPPSSIAEDALKEIAAEVASAESARLISPAQPSASSEIQIHHGGHKVVFLVEPDPAQPFMRRLLRRGLRETQVLADNIPAGGFQAIEADGEWVLRLRRARWDWAEPGAEEVASVTVRR